MKELNNKGFTLVELLAVIIILAIVVGISIPAITNVINDSKNNAMGVAVESASKYLTDQYALMNVDINLVSENFYNAFGKNPEGDVNMFTYDLVEEAGLKTDNVFDIYAKLDHDTGKICVRIAQIEDTSEYYSTKYIDSDGFPKVGEGAKSSNCD